MAMARGANGATFANGDGPGECYAEFGMTASNGNTDWITCLFGNYFLSCFTLFLLG